MQRNRVWYLMDDISREQFIAFAREKAVVSLLIILLGRYDWKQRNMGGGTRGYRVQSFNPFAQSTHFHTFSISDPILRFYNGSLYIYCFHCPYAWSGETFSAMGFYVYLIVRYDRWLGYTVIGNALPFLLNHLILSCRFYFLALGGVNFLVSMHCVAYILVKTDAASTRL